MLVCLSNSCIYHTKLKKEIDKERKQKRNKERRKRPASSISILETRYGNSPRQAYLFCCWLSNVHETRRTSGMGLLRQLYMPPRGEGIVCLLVGCLTSHQHASVSQGRICSDNFTCCHTEIEVADQTFHLTQSQYTDTGPTSPSADPITPGAWQGSHWRANV